jgi:hypothetical protein
MSVYVGIDVHRKRSQVAVVTEDGTVQLNKNTVNGTTPILQLIGGLPPGPPVAFEAAFGWGWLVQLLEDYGFDPHMVHPLQCKAIASARLKNDKGRRGDLGPAAPRGPAPGGVDRTGAGPPAPRAAAAPGRAGPAAHPAAEPDPRGGGRLRLRPVRQLPDRARARLAGRARAARDLPGDRDRRPGGHRQPGGADRADRRRAAPARQGRPASQGPDHAAGRGPVHRPCADPCSVAARCQSAVLPARQARPRMAEARRSLSPFRRLSRRDASNKGRTPSGSRCARSVQSRFAIKAGSWYPIRCPALPRLPGEPGRRGCPPSPGLHSRRCCARSS